MGILEELRSRRVFFDGGTGSLLQAQGLKPGEPPETWNLLYPERIVRLHLDYLDAGSDVITTNTFGANRFKFKKEDGFSVKEIVAAAVKNARTAIQKAGHGFAALDLGPTGKLLKPYGELEFEDAVAAYKEVAKAGEDAGADLVIIETMGDSYELKAAVLGAKEGSSLPVFATVTLDEKGKMLTGGGVEAVTALLEGLGVDVIGLNCGLGPIQLLPFVKQMAAVASVPLLVNPNAGLPRSENGRTVYDIDSDAFAAAMQTIALSGAALLGGCCGTTPEHIKKTRALCEELSLPPVVDKGRTVISSYSHVVNFGGRPILIGERINPTGKPRFKQALKEKDLNYILNVAAAQQESGADVLDVNVGLPEIDEAAMLETVVKELQSVLDLPLQLDTSNPGAMERAMRCYNGKPLINSVNGKREVMEAVFPLVKRYGGVVVALCLDEDGIPETANGRIAVARKIYETAASYGIGKKDILVDALCMAVSSDQNGALTTLETVRRVQDELGGRTVLGVSNVSFGLPMREHINAAFFLSALWNGLSAGIINPNSASMMAVYDSFLVLTAQDENCVRYISAYAEKEAEKKREKAAGAQRRTKPGVPGTEGGPKKAASGTVIPSEAPGAENKSGASCRVAAADQKAEKLRQSILRGMPNAAGQAAEAALGACDALTLIHEEMIPALDEVGRGFEAGTVFLPQLLMSAEAAKAAFAVIKERMAADGGEQEKRGCVILATVKGDVHDIGKNIVKVLLENYSFDVIDLGRDVAPEQIVKAAVERHAPLVGLSALMTTTVPAMEATIAALRKEAPWTKIMVGGAVLTKEYADSIGADAYCKDAMASVNFASYVTKGMAGSEAMKENGQEMGRQGENGKGK
ncbi:MAG: dihydropteroate synthase [Lachnospiraceae bacterium]|nr:dihydropteroate synthase [Lachnospiraceae bacterium]